MVTCHKNVSEKLKTKFQILSIIGTDLHELQSIIYHDLKFKYLITCFWPSFNTSEIIKYFKELSLSEAHIRMFLGDLTFLLAIILLLTLHFTAVHSQ